MSNNANKAIAHMIAKEEKGLRAFYPQATDFMCAVDDRLCALQERNTHAIPVLGGAVYAAEYAEKNDLQKFMEYLPRVIESAYIYSWEGGIADALRTFCNLCLIDPTLIEVLYGKRFADIESAYVMRAAEIGHKPMMTAKEFFAKRA